MPQTNPFFDRLADIQAHLLCGGTVHAITPNGTLTYARCDVTRFSATSHGLYVTYEGQQGCLNTATITLR